LLKNTYSAITKKYACKYSFLTTSIHLVFKRNLPLLVFVI
jgi:hypothetical protein